LTSWHALPVKQLRSYRGRPAALPIRNAGRNESRLSAHAAAPSLHVRFEPGLLQRARLIGYHGSDRQETKQNVKLIAPNIQKTAIQVRCGQKLPSRHFCRAEMWPMTGIDSVQDSIFNRKHSMRRIKHFIAAGLASICALGTAAAVDMTGAEIQALISGKTGYVETGAGSVTGTVGQGAIYSGADGNGLYKTPKGPIWHGSWSIKGDLYCSVRQPQNLKPTLAFPGLLLS
jgi:hypothetical protein